MQKAFYRPFLTGRILNAAYTDNQRVGWQINISKACKFCNYFGFWMSKSISIIEEA